MKISLKTNSSIELNIQDYLKCIYILNQRVILSSKNIYINKSKKNKYNSIIFNLKIRFKIKNTCFEKTLKSYNVFVRLLLRLEIKKNI